MTLFHKVIKMSVEQITKILIRAGKTEWEKDNEEDKSGIRSFPAHTNECGGISRLQDGGDA